MILENDGTDFRDLWVVRLHEDTPLQRLTPGLAANETINEFAISPDAGWAIYRMTANAEEQLWLVDLHDLTQRERIPLPSDGTVLNGSIQFAKTSKAFYFLTGSQVLYRVRTDAPGSPIAIAPQPPEAGSAGAYFSSSDDSYVIVHGFLGGELQVFNVSTSDPAQRTVINAPLVGNSVGAMTVDSTGTRIAYLTNGSNATSEADDELYVADIAHPGIATLAVSADPARTGPIGTVSFRPDLKGLLVLSWSAVNDDYQLDLAEVSLDPADQQLTPVSLPPPAGSRTVNHGDYDGTGDAVIYSISESFRLQKVMEARRGAFATPVMLGTPGIITTIHFSSDEAILGMSHNSAVPEDPATYIKLMNRSFPQTLIKVSSAGSAGSFSRLLFGLIEDP